MQGAPFSNGHTGGPEHISRGEFQNVIGPLWRALEKLEKSQVDTQNAIGEIREAIRPMLDASTEEKVTRRDNRLALIGFITATASSIVAGIAVYLAMLGG